MNIVTKQDVKRFIELFKIGIRHGDRKELKNYTSYTNYVDGTDVSKRVYVSIEFSCMVDAEHVQEYIEKENFGSDFNDLLNLLD